jgi:hypothetical protein
MQKMSHYSNGKHAPKFELLVFVFIWPPRKPIMTTVLTLAIISDDVYSDGTGRSLVGYKRILDSKNQRGFNGAAYLGGHVGVMILVIFQSD